ncbi:uncharacterized protein [Magallana gigas]|uniref:Uncharacterized protein n=1 Tax=Magallana gigas TaxID=29159 RepID=K1QBH2_MAGGI
MSKKPRADDIPESPILKVVQKKGGVAFDIRYKSTVPKLPPINVRWVLVPVGGEDYEKWKAERDKLLLVDKHEKAKIRRERTIQQKKLSAQRPRTARPSDVIESTNLID